jgi:predicted cupin superfamily sugar epimerase
MTGDEIIRLLELRPHPEGGHYREMFRDEADEHGRALSTAIYFLLQRGQRSHWHRIDAVEIWHWYAGAPLSLEIAADGRRDDHLLGSDIAAGERPQIVVPRGAWQAAETLGDYTLVGCTVAPGFLFEHFEMAPVDFAPDEFSPGA